jgi:hypothetical protein
MGTQPGNNHLGGAGGGRAPGGSFTGVSHVKLVSNATDEDFQTGRTKAPIITVEQPQSVNILVDSRNRFPGGTPFDFNVTISANLFRSRFMKVSKIALPKFNNITKNNNVLTITTALLGTFTITIRPGHYSASEIRNEMTNLLNEASDAIDPLNEHIWVIDIDQITGTFKFTLQRVLINTNISLNTPFYFHSGTNFITRGANFMPLPTSPPGSDPGVVGRTYQHSSLAELIYTRYCLLCSGAFNTYSFADSKTTDPFLNEDVLAIVDLSPERAQINLPAISTPEAPRLSLRNPQRNLSPEADIYLLDEYGINVDETFDLGNDSTGNPYPPNVIGLKFWMEVTF